MQRPFNRPYHLSVGVYAFCLTLDAILGEPISIAIKRDASQVQHRLCTLYCSAHVFPFHSVFDEVPAGALNDARSNWIACGQVFVIAHPMLVVLKEPCK